MADAPVGGRPRLAVLLLGGTYDRAHYALATAAAAAALDRPVTLFVTLGATRAFLAPAAEGAAAGWARLPLSPELGGGPDCADGAALDARYRARGVAGFEELLAACRDLGVRIMVCEMGLRALGIGAEALRPDLAFERGGLATLLGEGGAVVTF
ncbi:MAG TPA: DsrE family protein [Geminicoccaceae bacterium]|nr:DsrE family protein [Geminicoccaceae bacterium]